MSQCLSFLSLYVAHLALFSLFLIFYLSLSTLSHRLSSLLLIFAHNSIKLCSCHLHFYREEIRGTLHTSLWGRTLGWRRRKRRRGTNTAEKKNKTWQARQANTSALHSSPTSLHGSVCTAHCTISLSLLHSIIYHLDEKKSNGGDAAEK